MCLAFSAKCGHHKITYGSTTNLCIYDKDHMSALQLKNRSESHSLHITGIN